MSTMMQALVYEAPYQMNVRETPLPQLEPDQVLIKVAFSGICGSELSGFEGKNSLRRPPLIFGHEFSGTVTAMGENARQTRPDLREGQRVTANPLITCGKCRYCASGRNQLCAERKLLSAHLPGSNTEYVAVRADAVIPIPSQLSLEQAALAEPAACTIHAARLANAEKGETALVVGAGPIGLLMIQALHARGLDTVFATDLNAERLAMAEALGAKPVHTDDAVLQSAVDLAIDAVGLTATRQACLAAIVPGGRVVWIGLHESHSSLDINDMSRRELTTIGSFAYAPQDFQAAVDGLSEGRFGLPPEWTRVEPLSAGRACFEELLHGSSVAKIWLKP